MLEVWEGCKATELAGELSTDSSGGATVTCEQQITRLCFVTKETLTLYFYIKFCY